MTDNTKSYKYDVFISYSRKNEAFAGKLEQALESYKPEKDLKVPQRFIEAFRDKEDFTGSNYHKSLLKNLNDSSKLIVVCSPEARESRYVNDEIKQFVDVRGADHIIPVLFTGIPNNEAKAGQENEMAFPDELCKAIEMPLAVNYLGFNVQKDKINKGIFTDSWYSILADTYNLSRSEMEQREKRRRARKRRFTVSVLSASLMVLFVLLIFALVSRSQAKTEQEKAEIAQQNAETAQKAEKEQREIAEGAKKDADIQRDAAIEAKRQTDAALISAKEAKALAETKRKEAEEAAKNERIAKDQAEERRKQAELAAENERIAKKQALDEKDKANAALRTALTENGRDELTGNYPFRAAVYLDRASRIPLINENYTELSTIKFLLGQAIRKVEALRFSVNKVDSASFSKDGKEIFAFGENGLSIWNTETGKETKSSLSEDQAQVLKDNSNEALSPNGKLLATGGYGGIVKILDSESRKEIGSFQIEGILNSISFSPDGENLLVGSDDFLAKVVRVRDRGIISTFENQSSISSAAFSPDSKRVFTLGIDRILKVWDLQQEQKFYDDNDTRPLWSAEISKDGKLVAAAGFKGIVHVWSTESQKQLFSLNHGEPVTSVQFSPDSTKLITVGNPDNRYAKLWSLTEGNEIMNSEFSDTVLNSIAFSADGKYIFTVDDSGMLKKWSFGDRHTLNLIENPSLEQMETSRSFSNDGKFFVMNGDGKNAHKYKWDGINFTDPQILKHLRKVNSIFYSHDGKSIVTASEDTTVKIWNADTCQNLRTFVHKGIVQSASFSPDDTKIVSVGFDKTVRIWDVKTEKEIATFQGNFNSVTFSFDGNSVVTTENNGIVRIWNIAADTHSLKEIDSIIKEKIPFSLINEVLVPNDLNEPEKNK
ncbi:MAG: TIR domain-containing protein [Acidobacteriota bacterium]|nr:TIR domain-containing protein [Acidobacteriota bacterium]